MRILEFEVEGEEGSGRSLLVEVELWDCSGSKQWVIGSVGWDNPCNYMSHLDFAND